MYYKRNKNAEQISTKKMKQILIIFIIVFLRIEFILAQEDYSNFQADTSISGIILHDSLSYKLKLKHYPNYNIDNKGPGSRIKLKNKNGNELLTLIFHAGGYKYNTAEIIVEDLEYFDLNESIEYKLNESNFKTENSIQLGFSKDKIISLKGDKFKESNIGEQNILDYTINYNDTFSYLCRHNMPEYYEEFVFVEDKLVRFSFGFTYP